LTPLLAFGLVRRLMRQALTDRLDESRAPRGKENPPSLTLSRRADRFVSGIAN